MGLRVTQSIRSHCAKTKNTVRLSKMVYQLQRGTLSHHTILWKILYTFFKYQLPNIKFCPKYCTQVFTYLLRRDYLALRTVTYCRILVRISKYKIMYWLFDFHVKGLIITINTWAKRSLDRLLAILVHTWHVLVFSAQSIFLP